MMVEPILAFHFPSGLLLIARAYNARLSGEQRNAMFPQTT